MDLSDSGGEEEDQGPGAAPALSEGELIRRRQERKRRRQDRLLRQLERKKVKRDREEREEKLAKRTAAALASQQGGGGGKRGRSYTVSVALPGSILDNAQSPELKAYLAGQVARSLAIFNVDEVVIFDDRCVGTGQEDSDKGASGDFDGLKKNDGGCVQLARILQFLECPQYLRKSFFPLHRDLKFAGVLNPTDMPHHLRAAETESKYREGVVLDRPGEGKSESSWAYVGLQKEVLVDKRLEPGLRVTVQLDKGSANSKRPRGRVVSPRAPRTEDGLYWGYTVRLADSLSAVFSKCPFKGGYDLTVGTSERGSSVDEAELESGFRHLLVAFGGLSGLEAALEADESLSGDDPAPLFNLYLNTCPAQGSRTIRTEEAILVTLSSLRPKIDLAQKKKN